MFEGKTIGKYKFLTKLGNNNMHLAEDTTDKSKVAIKVHEYNVNYLLSQQDINLLKKLKHENILSPLKVIKKGAYIYTIYKYYEKDTLYDYVKNKGVLEENEVKEKMKQIVKGYSKLWENNLAHRNIKPQNILIIEGVLKLYDFGIATKESFINELYLAPEVITRKKVLTFYNDVWSIGAVMYFMLTGHDPLLTIKQKIINEYTLKKEVSAYCLSFMRQCLQYRACRRLTYKKMITHPFIAEQAEEAKTPPDLHLIEENKKETNREVKLGKYPTIKPYICYCGVRPDVTLNCKHNFCIGCAIKLRERATIIKQEIDYFITQHEISKDFKSLLITCPQCFAQYKICNYSINPLVNIKLSCGCELKESTVIRDKISRFSSELADSGSLFC